ncbi:MAG: metallophosphoesterase [Bacteroidaceae bacterium]|nr:metallophosphoesterase [Bacteroidaceae bacterium]
MKVLFVLILCLIYVIWHLWNLLPLSALWKSIILILGMSCVATLFLDFSGKLDDLPMGIAKCFYAIGTTSIIMLLYLFIILLVADIGRLFHIIPKSFLYSNWYSVISLCAFLGVVFIIGNFNYYNKVRVPIELTTDKLLDKEYKVVMASDLHLGYHNSKKDLAKWVDMINAEKPDFILIAGDIIDISVRPLFAEEMADEFLRLKAPVYAILGNHEYYSGEPKAKEFYKRAKINLLVDDVAEINSTFLLVGRDDRTNRRRKPLKDILQNVDSSKYIILLDHQPYKLEQAERYGVDFQFSGHTHRGQVWPISWVTDALYECSWGEHSRGNTNYYVSSGLGIWGAKLRIGTQSEYVVATFKNR